MRFFSKTLLDFIYPASCIHCGTAPTSSEGPFCLLCATLLELITPQERCPYCFSLDYDPEKQVCYSCFLEKPILHRSAAAFDYTGAAATLVSRLKYSGQPYLAEGAGAYMALQLINLGWPKPDLIVPVPLTFMHKIYRGYNQSLLLAKGIGKIIDSPAQELLKRGLLDFSQAGMTRKQRMRLGASSFMMKRGVDIRDKTILLVDDVWTTGRTMNCCAEVLYAGFPKAVYGLTLCKAM